MNFNDNLVLFAYELDQVINKHIEERKITINEYLYVMANLYVNFCRMIEQNVENPDEIIKLRDSCMNYLALFLYDDDFLNNEMSDTTH